jgi:acyl dehydratase
MTDWEGDDWEVGDPDTEASVFHDIEVGRTVRTQGRTVTESDLTNFAGVSGDFNHLHTDEERMADSMFGERIAHGMFVFSAATGLIWQARSPEERASVVAFYGIDRVRFRAPVFVGDTVHVELEVVDKEERERGPGTGVVTYDLEVVNGEGTTVLSCEMRSLMR